MARPISATAGTGVFMMVIIALLFGYFGFGIGWREVDADGNRIWIVSVFKWTLQVVCIGAALSAVLHFVQRWAAATLFVIVSLASAIMFAAVVVWHYATDAPAPIQPFIIIILALINGYGGWLELRELFAGSRGYADKAAHNPKA